MDRPLCRKEGSTRDPPASLQQKFLYNIAALEDDVNTTQPLDKAVLDLTPNTML